SIEQGERGVGEDRAPEPLPLATHRGCATPRRSRPASVCEERGTRSRSESRSIGARSRRTEPMRRGIPVESGPVIPTLRPSVRFLIPRSLDRSPRRSLPRYRRRIVAECHTFEQSRLDLSRAPPAYSTSTLDDASDHRRIGKGSRPRLDSVLPDGRAKQSVEETTSCVSPLPE